jgi:dolichyl-phosphate-mannose--protein O-mannosyl transferase
MKKYFNIAVKIFTWIVQTVFIFALLYKVHANNDVTTTLKQDPMENWIALGIVFILTTLWNRKPVSFPVLPKHSNN